MLYTPQQPPLGLKNEAARYQGQKGFGSEQEFRSGVPGGSDGRGRQGAAAPRRDAAPSSALLLRSPSISISLTDVAPVGAILVFCSPLHFLQRKFGLALHPWS